MKMFTKDEVVRGLETKIVGKRIFIFDSIDSTNQCARTLADTGAVEGTVVVANHQTSGRGRLGRNWISAPGSNILCSILLRPAIRKDSAGLLTFLAAVSAARAVESVATLSVECKWPNDLLLSGKKCCGILLENTYQGEQLLYSVVGIGLNVNQTEFANLESSATSVSREAGAPQDRVGLLRTMLRNFDSLYAEAQEGRFDGILRDWNVRCRMFGRPVALEGAHERLEGVALRLSPDGGLILQTPDGQRTVHAGDASVSAEVA